MSARILAHINLLNCAGGERAQFAGCLVAKGDAAVGISDRALAILAKAVEEPPVRPQWPDLDDAVDARKALWFLEQPLVRSKPQPQRTAGAK
jgi:hypothetical protein